MISLHVEGVYTHRYGGYKGLACTQPSPPTSFDIVRRIDSTLAKVGKRCRKRTQIGHGLEKRRQERGELLPRLRAERGMRCWNQIILAAVLINHNRRSEVDLLC